MSVTTETMETSLPPTSARSFETVEEIAARFRVSEETARRWLRARKPVVAGRDLGQVCRGGHPPRPGRGPRSHELEDPGGEGRHLPRNGTQHGTNPNR
jgi:hypothetical protein